MSHRTRFDKDRYIELQSRHIQQRRDEMGGKLFDDMHASRVLPGFTPDNKIAMLENPGRGIRRIAIIDLRIQCWTTIESVENSTAPFPSQFH